MTFTFEEDVLVARDDQSKSPLVPHVVVTDLETQRPQWVAGGRWHIDKATIVPIARIGSALISMAFFALYVQWILELRKQLEASCRNTALLIDRLDDEVMHWDVQWIGNARMLLDRIGADTLLLQEVDDTSFRVSQIVRRMDEMQESLESLQTAKESRMAWLLIDGIEGSAALATEAALLSRELETLRSRHASIRAQTAGLLRDETAVLRSELLLFQAQLDGLLIEADRSVSDESLQLRQLVLTLADLAEAIYVRTSLVAKRSVLSSSQQDVLFDERLRRLGVPRREDMREVRSAARNGRHVRRASTATSATVISKGLHLRAGPSTTHGVLCTLYEEEVVGVLSRDGTWWRVATSCGNGWASGRFLQIVQ